MKMKRIIPVALAAGAVLTATTPVLADGTTTITTTVPEATYTLNIPADTVIPFGKKGTDIGQLTVTNSKGFAKGKNLKVTVDYSELKSDTTSTTIPYTIYGSYYKSGDTIDTVWGNIKTGDAVTFPGLANGECEEKYREKSTAIYGLLVMIESTDWGKALAGNYSSTITFTSKVVAE